LHGLHTSSRTSSWGLTRPRDKFLSTLPCSMLAYKKLTCQPLHIGDVVLDVPSAGIHLCRCRSQVPSNPLVMFSIETHTIDPTIGQRCHQICRQDIFGYFQESERLNYGVRVRALQLWRPQPCIDNLINIGRLGSWQISYTRPCVVTIRLATSHVS
jgi:hypothetical protein